MFRRFLPQEGNFFDHFERHAGLVVQACREFRAIVGGNVDVTQEAERIKQLEQQADVVTHQCVDALNRTFITPIDRVDIHQLIKRLDDIIDSLDATTTRMALYKLTEMRPETIEFANVLLRAVEEIEGALKLMRDMKNAEGIKERMIRVHHLESDADDILRNALSKLFEEDDKPLFVIKWKEIFERLEKATDRCEEVANIIETIVIEAT
jgi:hypothetical protein